MITDTLIRLATRADAADIAAMSRDFIEHGLPWSWREGRIVRAIRDPDTNVAVAVDRRTLIAFGIMSYADRDAQLLLFAVRPSHRRRGVGSAVLHWLETVARNLGNQRVHVECRRNNVAARNFYAELGYLERVISRGRYLGIEDGIRLEKWLPTGAD